MLAALVLDGPADFGVTKPAITKWTEKPRVLCEPIDVLVTVKGAGVGKMYKVLSGASVPE